MTQLRDQALVVVWGAHTVAESLVDQMNDFNSSNDFTDCGLDRHYKKEGTRTEVDFGVKYIR